MSQLPPGWRSASIADLVSPDGVFSDGDWVESKDQDPAGAIRLLQLADVGDGVFVDKSNRFVNDEKFEKLRCTEVFEDDVLIARMPEPLGRACLAPRLRQRCITVVDVAILRPGASSVMPKWLMHFLNAPPMREIIELQSSGTTRRRISRGNLAKLELPVPPLPEQKRIADKLDSLLSRVATCRERLNRVPGVISRFRQAVLAAATSGELTREWREARGLDRSPFERRVPLGSVCIESFYGPRFGKDEYVSGGIPTIRTTDMTRGGRIHITSDTPRVAIPKNKLEQFAVRKGDLLITRTGSIGVMAVVDGDYVAVPSAYLIRFRFRPDILPRFVFFCLTAPYGRERLGLSTTAVTQPNINAEAIKRIDVAVPSVEEQLEIIRRADELLAIADRVEARLNSASQLTARMVSAILAKAFRGELVPQDADDEPASELLARIRHDTAVPHDSGKPKRGGARGPRLKTKTETDMLTRKDVTPTHLSSILKARGALTAEALWSASQMEIDEFYSQLKDEEARGLLRENRSDSPTAPRLLEVVA